MPNDPQRPLRHQLIKLLQGSDAHLQFKDAVAHLEATLRGRRVAPLPHSAWELLEHMRIAQWDILEFSRNPRHKSPAFPKGYWPQSPAPPDARAWQTSIRAFQTDLKAMIALIKDPAHNLYEPFAYGQGQTLLREALVLADHNAYHLGQFVQLRRLLGAWE